MMQIRTCAFFLSFSFLFLFLPKNSLAEIGDKVPGCLVLYNAAKAQALKDLGEMEAVYARYRTAEFKIRIFEYERLWKARSQSNDPLSKEIRQDGQREEDRLLQELALIDKDSEKASNGFLEGLRKLQALPEVFVPCCPDPDIQKCLGKSFEPVSEKLELGIQYFGHVFEREREYREAVSLTLGGRRGIYPEDTVESAVQHTDFFPRYEVERRQTRFEEDAWMAHFFQDLRKMLTDAFPGDHCCLGCGVTDWDRKSEKFFHETK